MSWSGRRGNRGVYELRNYPGEVRSFINMNSRDIARLRLINQHLALAGPAGPGQMVTGPVSTPAELVKWMGCIQAQDYAMAKWALGCRLPHSTDTDIEKAFQEGHILRTHALRPTWHFVCPEDIRWLLQFNAPKVRALSRPYLRQLGIDAAILKKSKTLLTRALGEHGKLTRPQLAAILRKGKIATDDARLGHLLMDAELDAIICSAGRIGKQFAYELLDGQGVGSHDGPVARVLGNDDAIVELARRYFPSRGPATVQDFAWWGGLTLTEARKGLDAVRAGLECVNEYWFVPPTDTARPGSTWLLPAFDEYTVAYKNRDDVLDPAHASACFYGLKPIIVHNTRVIGMWQRTLKKGKAIVETIPFPGTKAVPARALAAAIKKYEDFMG